MKSPFIPSIVQAVGLACVPVDDMPPNSSLARKPVAAAIVTVAERGDGHRDAVIKSLSDARDMEWPLPVLIDDALIAGAPTIIADSDRDVLTVEAASRRFFAEPTLGALATGQGVIDPAAMLGERHDEAALCRRIGIPANLVPDTDVGRWWNRNAPVAVEDVALTAAVSRLVLWAHFTSFRSAEPDAFFETLLPLRERLMELEADHPALKPFLASRPFHRAASFASFYREYRVKRDGGDTEARWVTFEDGQSYV
ncbi:hypothetical protein [Sphingomonas sp. 3P27F8]|uniref:hypothetical protein n=1 Tax=Sphingomonas sp. 3P27F8 TaxID=2502213 RepID=UPI0010F5E939|nr:hypothetical protein [Sphingomonas sp. 3P27F8]